MTSNSSDSRQIKDWWTANDDLEAKRKRREQRRQQNQSKSSNTNAFSERKTKRKIRTGKRFYTVPTTSWGDLVTSHTTSSTSSLATASNTTPHDSNKSTSTLNSKPSSFSFTSRIDGNDSDSADSSESDSDSDVDGQEFGTKSFKFGNDWKIPKHGASSARDGSDSDDGDESDIDIELASSATTGVALDAMGNIIDTDQNDAASHLHKTGTRDDSDASAAAGVDHAGTEQMRKDKNDLRKDIESGAMESDELFGMEDHPSQGVEELLFDKNGKWKYEIKIDFGLDWKPPKGVEKDETEDTNEKHTCQFMRQERTWADAMASFQRDTWHFERVLKQHERWVARKRREHEYNQMTGKTGKKRGGKFAKGRKGARMLGGVESDNESEAEEIDRGDIEETLARSGWNEKEFEKRQHYYDYETVRTKKQNSNNNKNASKKGNRKKKLSGTGKYMPPKKRQKLMKK